MLDGRGAFQTRSQDPNLQCGGNTVLASGRHIVYGYQGEFYTDPANGRVGQANQFMHFRDDGLFLGQFGVPTTQARTASQPGVAGNAFSPTLVRMGQRIYLYHNDESTHGGVHRWRRDGADAVQELSGRGRLGSSITLRCGPARGSCRRARCRHQPVDRALLANPRTVQQPIVKPLAVELEACAAA